MKPYVVFVDVDDTLICSVGSKRIPMPGVVAELRQLHVGGATLYLWSSGGADYARKSAIELGIVECFAGFLPKPHVIIDDQPVSQWHNCRHIPHKPETPNCPLRPRRADATGIHIAHNPGIEAQCSCSVHSATQTW